MYSLQKEKAFNIDAIINYEVSLKYCNLNL